jgi:hypothetical protein
MAIVKKKRAASPPENPILSRMEERILEQIIEWADQYKIIKDAGDIFASDHAPTTERCSKHFNYSHNEMLALLNQLEQWHLIQKRRRLSAGISGDGYDGSLHSEVIPTERGRKVLLQNKQA